MPSPRRRRSLPLAQQRAVLAAVHERLVDLRGAPVPGERLAPLDEVVLTILSQNTTDTNRDRAWERLRSRFPDWQGVVEAPLEEVEDALRPGGLHRVKAQRIRETLVQIEREHGAYSLDHLAEAGEAQARSELGAIKGLGAKSVNCVLLFSLGLPAFPVDTHVFRVLARIGAHRARDLARANDELQEAVPAGQSYALHVNLIHHGREVCHARKPECWRCGLADLCAFDAKRTAAS